MPKIFISYRRIDSNKDAGRIYDRLGLAFGSENVFIDFDKIPTASVFPVKIKEALHSCHVLLAIIGKKWLTVKNKDGQRRLDDPLDFVRMEVATALGRGGCLVVPVLVDNAKMPSANILPMDLRDLVTRNAIEISNDPRFHSDVNKLIDAINEHSAQVQGFFPSASTAVHSNIGFESITVFSGNMGSDMLRLLQISGLDSEQMRELFTKAVDAGFLPDCPDATWIRCWHDPSTLRERRTQKFFLHNYQGMELFRLPSMEAVVFSVNVFDDSKNAANAYLNSVEVGKIGRRDGIWIVPASRELHPAITIPTLNGHGEVTHHGIVSTGQRRLYIYVVNPA